MPESEQSYLESDSESDKSNSKSDTGMEWKHIATDKCINIQLDFPFTQYLIYLNGSPNERVWDTVLDKFVHFYPNNTNYNKSKPNIFPMCFFSIFWNENPKMKRIFWKTK